MLGPRRARCPASRLLLAISDVGRLVMAISVSFDDLEPKIIHALQVDGRAPFSKIASVLGVSDQTVARRYACLRSARQIRVTGRTD